MKRICVLGNFSGRNAGDAAILGCLVEDISRVFPAVEFLVPTINTGFVKRSCNGYPVKAVSLLPWALSLKIFGLPTFRAVLGADLVLITDNILFDRKLFNPLFNYLSTLSVAIPMAKRRGVPTAFYNASLGPISTRLGRYCLNQIVRNADLVILRDVESEKILNELHIEHGEISIAADCALNTEPAGEQRVAEIVRQEGLLTNSQGTIGINVNSYLDVYVRKNGNGLRPADFIDTMAETVRQLIRELHVDVLFVITQIMDLKIARAIASKIADTKHVKLISNEKYSYRDLAGVMSKLDILVGMRTHSLILAAAVNTPVAGVVSYPKTVGFLKSIQQERWMVTFDDFSVTTCYALSKQLWENRLEIRTNLAEIITREKRKAVESAEKLGRFLS